MKKFWESLGKIIGKNGHFIRILSIVFGIWLIFTGINVETTIKMQVLSTSKFGTTVDIGIRNPENRPFGQDGYTVRSKVQKDITKSMRLLRVGGPLIVYVRLRGPYKLKVQVYFGKKLCASKNLENKSEDQVTIFLQCDK